MTLSYPSPPFPPQWPRGHEGAKVFVVWRHDQHRLKDGEHLCARCVELWRHAHPFVLPFSSRDPHRSRCMFLPKHDGLVTLHLSTPCSTPSGCIQVSSSTYHLLASPSTGLPSPCTPGPAEIPIPIPIPLDGEWIPTGGLEVKGKGRMETWLWMPPETGFFDRPPPASALKVRGNQGCSIQGGVRLPA